MGSIITGTGSYIPTIVRTNESFDGQTYYDEGQTLIDKPTHEITKKFEEITGIRERRYSSLDLNNSDIASIAAARAIKDAGIDVESIDHIIFAHNFGDIQNQSNQTDILPALASRVKHNLGIKNSNCIPYDLIFGCPGWVQGVIQANTYFRAKEGTTALVIGSDMLSRILDPVDRDSLIFSDGAGACIIQDNSDENGVLATNTCAHTLEEVNYLFMGTSNAPESDPNERFIKMKGRKVYEYALKNVPTAMKDCIDKAGIEVKSIKKIFIHQANEKLDNGVVKRFYRLFGYKSPPENIMPMSVNELGNSSVATVPTLLDLVLKGKMKNHKLEKGDIILLASVGAGMNINCICYQI